MFESIIKFVTGEGRIVTPGEQAQTIAKEQKVVKIKFMHDIKALKDAGYKIEQGEKIVMDLKSALKLMPRDRKRTDAYKSLVDYLNKEFSCKLIVTSQKIRKEIKP